MKKCQIYSIKNIINNKRYIGSSIHLLTRLRVHFQFLRNNKHYNSKLQRSYNKYGKDNFITEILEEFEYDNSNIQFEREQYYIDKYDSFKNGLNESPTAYNGTLVKWSEERKIKVSKILSETRKGIKPSNFTEMQKTRWRPISEYESGKFIRTYKSTTEAGRVLNIDYRLIHNVLKNKVKKLTRYPLKTWKYND